MKLSKTTLCFLLVVTLLLAFSTRTWACCGGPVEGELTLKIKGIKIGDDIEKVKSILIPLEAITDCSVNMERGLLGLVLYPDLITEEVVIGLIRQAGFDATLPDRIDMHLNKSYQDETIRQATANLNSLLGVVVSDVDEESNIIHIDIYKRWVRDIKRLIKPIRDAGMDVTVDIETSVFTTDGMTEVDGHDVRAYLLNVFGVISSDYAPDNDKVEVTLLFCVLYSVIRFCVEIFRDDNPPLFDGMTISQNASILVFTAAIALFVIGMIKLKHQNLLFPPVT